MNENAPEPNENAGDTVPAPEGQPPPPPSEGGAIDKVSHSMDQHMGAIESMFSTQMVVLGLALGLLLMLIGTVVINLSTINDEKADQGDYADARGTHQNGAILFNLGITIMIGILLGAAIFNTQLDQFARLGMLIAAGFIIANGFSLYGA